MARSSCILVLFGFLSVSGCKTDPVEPDPVQPVRSVLVSALPDIGTAHTVFSLKVVQLVDSDTITAAGRKSMWDWENDGVFDTPWLDSLAAEHFYGALGKTVIKVLVKNPSGDVDSALGRVYVQELVQITYNATGNSQDNIDWSRDGSNRILFEWAWDSPGSCCGAAWMVQYPGGTPDHAITANDTGMGTDHSFPEWSPDGRKFVFQRYPQNDHVIFDLVSRVGTSLGPKHGLQSAWSPDGRYILTSDTLFDLVTMSGVSVPSSPYFAWSPTEGTLCLASFDTDPLSGGSTRSVRIVSFPDYSVMDELNIPWGAKFDWSLDGRFIALGFSDSTLLHVLDYQTKQVYRLQADGLNYCWWPSWSEDGSFLAFEATEQGAGRRLEIWAIRFPADL